MSTRNIINVMLFDVRTIYTQRLWEPETKDVKGNPMETPQYSLTVIVPKTRANWAEEPALQTLGQAMHQVYQQQMAPAGIQMQYVEWGVKDGDRPNTKGKIPEWGKGHWVVRIGSGFKPTVSAIVNGSEVELPAHTIGGRKLFGDGDRAIVSVGVTVSGANPSRIKLYLGTTVFSAKDEAIQLGGGVSAAEMIAQAKAQGVNVQGIAGPAVGQQFGGASFGQQGGQQFGGNPAMGGGFAAGPGAGQQAGGGFNPAGNAGGFGGAQAGNAGGFNPAGNAGGSTFARNFNGDDIPF